MAYSTLYDYYNSIGQSLPSLQTRSQLYQQAGLGSSTSYTGSATQNTSLLNYLQKSSSTPTTATTPTSSYTPPPTTTQTSTASGNVSTTVPQLSFGSSATQPTYPQPSPNPFPAGGPLAPTPVTSVNKGRTDAQMQPPAAQTAPPPPPPDFQKTQTQFQAAIINSKTDVTSGSAARSAVNTSNQVASSFPDATGVGSGDGLNLYPPPKTTDPNDPSVQIAKSIQDGIDQMKNLSQQWTTYLQNEGSLQDYYNQLAGSSAGPTGQSYNDLTKSMLSINNVMRMSESDIRSELTANGGTATESQVQALVGARNKVLELQAQSISDQLNAQTNYVNQMMQYHQADQKTAENNFATAFDINSKMMDFYQKEQDTQFNQSIKYQTFLDNQVKNAFSQLTNLANAYVSTNGQTTISQSQAEWYANLFQQSGTPITAAQVMGFVQNKSALDAAKANIASSQAQIDYYKASAKAAGVTVKTSQDQSRYSAVTSFLDSSKGTDGFVSASSYAEALQRYVSAGGTLSSFTSQFDPSQYLTRKEMDNLPGTVPALNNIKFQADLQDFLGAVNSGQIDATKAMQTLTSQYPDQATKIKEAFAPFQ